MSLYATARAVLDALTVAYQGDGIDLPERRYVTPGVQPAYDGEQVTVTVLALRNGQPGNETQVPRFACAGPLYASLRVEVIRCTPTVDEDGYAPEAADLDASAMLVLSDVESLTRHLPGIAQTIAGQGSPVLVANAVPVGPDGGYAGAQVDLDLPLY